MLSREEIEDELRDVFAKMSAAELQRELGGEWRELVEAELARRRDESLKPDMAASESAAAPAAPTRPRRKTPARPIEMKTAPADAPAPMATPAPEEPPARPPEPPPQPETPPPVLETAPPAEPPPPAPVAPPAESWIARILRFLRAMFRNKPR